MDNHENLKCLTGLDLSNLKLIDSTKDGFATVVMKPIVGQDRALYRFDGCKSGVVATKVRALSGA
jgi:hypothetical protein